MAVAICVQGDLFPWPYQASVQLATRSDTICFAVDKLDGKGIVATHDSTLGGNSTTTQATARDRYQWEYIYGLYTFTHDSTGYQPQSFY